MARYRTTKCPYCGYILESMSISAKELIGKPLETCPSCQKQYRTGMKYWKDMNGGEKSWYIVRSILLFPYTLILYAAMWTFIPLGLISWIFDVDLFKE